MTRKRRGTIATEPATPRMMAVFDGRECSGFILARAGGRFEAFDASEKSLGIYASQRQAAAAIPIARSERAP